MKVKSYMVSELIDSLIENKFRDSFVIVIYHNDEFESDVFKKFMEIHLKNEKYCSLTECIIVEFDNKDEMDKFWEKYIPEGDLSFHNFPYCKKYAKGIYNGENT